ncbi:MAG TPA: aspartyl/asparaginyl beta-hydroxylase domain-containing protein [Rhizomicrobium sp.]|nr:aspartyl/asparaginyl beta-hydroxylase domain-containing protein [Rhizomicrobium sp.]
MQPNPRKTTSLRELGAVDIAALRDAVLAIPEDIWNEQNLIKPNRFEALASTRHIVFRFVRDVADWRASFDLPLWRDFAHLLEPVMTQAVKPYGYRSGAYPRIMLARMARGGEIKPHQDANLSAFWPHKIHVPLLTNDQVQFYLAPNVYHLKTGIAYEVNNMGVHAVRNGGDTDRIHLIFEYFDTEQPES